MILRVGAASAVIAFVASAASAQSGNGQAELKAQLEAARPPLYSGDKVVPGYTGSYSVAPGDCTTGVELMMPSLTIGGRRQAARTETMTVNWREVTMVGTADNYVIVKSPANPGGAEFYAATPEGARRMKTTIDGLVAACRAHAAAMPPPQPGTTIQAAASFAARTAIKPDVLGNPRCIFPAVPGLTVTQRDRPYVGSAVFRVPSRENAGKDTYFGVGVSESDRVTSWRGTLAHDPAFWIADERLTRGKIVRAAITLDGQPFAVPMTILHSQGFGQPWSSLVVVAPQYYADQDQWFARLEKGSLATVYLYDGGNNRYGPWTFDVTAFRNIPAAILGSRFRCQ